MNILRNIIRVVIALLAATLIVGVAGIQSALAAPVSAPARPNRSDVFVIMHPPTRNNSANTLTYTLVVANIGTEHASNIDITIPVNPKAGKVQNIRFSQDQSRLISQTASSIEVLVGRVDVRDQQTVALTFAMGSSVGSALPISNRVSFSWRNSGLDHGQGQSNLPSIAPAPIIHPLGTAPSGSQGNAFAFDSSIFVPNEPVTFWLNTQDGQVLPLYNDNGILTTNSSWTQDDKLTGFKKVTQPFSSNIRAGSQGDLSFGLDGSTLAPGAYTLVAQGFASKITAVASFRAQ